RGRDRAEVVPAPPLRPGHPATRRPGRRTTAHDPAPVGPPFRPPRPQEGPVPRLAPAGGRDDRDRGLPGRAGSGRDRRWIDPPGPRPPGVLVRPGVERPL